MSIEKRLRSISRRKVLVQITRRRRCKNGFSVIDPVGVVKHFPTRAIALSYLLARLRCHLPARFTLLPGCPP